MKCKEAYHYICENLDQNLNSRRCLEVRRHLSECPDCKSYLDSLKKTVQMYRTSHTPEVSADTHRKLLKAIDLAWRTSKGKRKKTTAV